MAEPWRFYVYVLTDANEVAYVGKGSGRRLSVQCRNRGCEGYELARFKRERDAYQFEREAIKEFRPHINRHPGGNGSRATRAKPWRPDDWKEIKELGSRRHVAKWLLERPWLLSLANHPSEVGEIRLRLQRVLDGPRC